MRDGNLRGDLMERHDDGIVLRACSMDEAFISR
jgi:hypothetical protein